MASPHQTWIVDDDPIARLLIRKTLERLEDFHPIAEMENGQELLNNIEALQDNIAAIPDLILLDLNMPVMDGWEFLDACSNRKLDLGSTKIVILTSSINPADEERSHRYSKVSTLIHKPLTVEDLERIKADIL